MGKKGVCGEGGPSWAGGGGAWLVWYGLDWSVVWRPLVRKKEERERAPAAFIQGSAFVRRGVSPAHGRLQCIFDGLTPTAAAFDSAELGSSNLFATFSATIRFLSATVRASACPGKAIDERPTAVVPNAKERREKLLPVHASSTSPPLLLAESARARVWNGAPCSAKPALPVHTRARTIAFIGAV